MKHLLMLTALFVTIACSNDSGTGRPTSLPLVNTPEISIPKVELDLEIDTPAAEIPGEVIDPTPVDPTPVDPTPVDPTPVDPTPVDPTPVDPTPVDPTPVDPTPVDPTPVDPTPVDPTPVDPTPVDPTPVDPTPAPTPDTLSCELVSQNERQTVTLKLNGTTATLAFPEADKIIVEGFRFTVDGVKHENPFYEYQGKRVLNVQGRVVFDTQTNEGQLQVSLRLKNRGAPTVTDFLPLANIASCR